MADSGKGFDEPGTIRRVFERLAEFFDSGVDAMLEIHEGVFRPKGRAQLLAADDFPVRFEKQSEDLQGLLLNGHTDAGAEQLTAVQVNLKRVKARPSAAVRTISSQYNPKLATSLSAIVARKQKNPATHCDS
jgi:hypothetical protein